MFYSGTPARVEWRTPTPPQRSLLKQLAAFFVAPRERPPATALAALREFGLPRIPNTSAEEELIGLLNCAAAIEHGLMAQYLYAAFSATDPMSQRLLTTVAIEEMGHLLTVQNLLVAGGAEPFLGRYDAMANLPIMPFPFRLEPLATSSLAKYAACEMPSREHVDPDEEDIIDELLREAKAAAHMDPARIGLLYIKIYWLLRESDDPLPNPSAEPWLDFPVAEVAKEVGPLRHVASFPTGAGAARQALRDHWAAYVPSIIISAVADRGAARAAVVRISEQGEGFGHIPDGHFDRLVRIYRIAKASTRPSFPVPVGPWHAGSTQQGQAAAQITVPETAALAAIGDGLYELCLLATLLYFQLPGAIDDEAHELLAKSALGLMTGGLGRARKQLLALGATGPDPNVLAGALCFGLPAADPPQGYAGLRDRSRALAGAVQAACAALEADAAAQAATRDVAGGIRDGAVTPLLDHLATLP